MSLWNAIASKLKEVWAKMLGSKTIESTLKVSPSISTEMENAILLWGRMYQGKAPWVKEPTSEDPNRVVSLGLPAMIASEKARTALLEWSSEITTPTESVEVENPNYTAPQPDMFGNMLPSTEPPTISKEQPVGDTSRAEFLNDQYEKKLKTKLRNQLEIGMAKGGFVIKPYPIIHEGKEGADTTAEIEFDFIQADSFYPISFDVSGRITEAAFVQTKKDKDNTYRRLEYHKWNGNSVEIVNKAFVKANESGRYSVPKTDDDESLGKEIKLTEVPEWADLQEKTTIANVDRPLFAYFKVPEANIIDPTSSLGASCFARAASLIHDADEQYSRLLWEFEGGEMAIDIDRDAIRPEMDSRGNVIRQMDAHQNRLYRKIDISNTGETYFPYAPQLRDASYTSGLNTILMRIEDVCAISRGTLSDGAAEARTATELKILKHRSYESNAEIQSSLESVLRDVIYIADVYCDLYNITPKGEYDVSFEWDDSLLVDKETELSTRMAMEQQGLISKLELRMWYFGETENQAKEALAKVDAETQQNMEQQMAMQANQIRMANQNQQEAEEE